MKMADRAESADGYVKPDQKIKDLIQSRARYYATAMATHGQRKVMIYEDRVQLLAALHFIHKKGFSSEFSQFKQTVARVSERSIQGAANPPARSGALATRPT